MALRMLSIEDHPLYAEALEFSIRGAWPETVIAHARSMREARSALRRAVPDLILLDLWLPDTQGFEGLIELRKFCPKVPVVISSAYSDDRIIQSAMAFGAAGFIPKSFGKTAIVQAVMTAIAGNAAYPPSYVSPDPALQKDLELLSSRLNSLTPQQLRVLQMLCHGLLNKQIAHELGIEETTVKAHVSEILRKLGVESRTQAVLQVSRYCFKGVLARYENDLVPNKKSNIRLAEAAGM